MAGKFLHVGGAIERSWEDEAWIALETPRFWRCLSHRLSPAKGSYEQNVAGTSPRMKKCVVVKKAGRIWRSEETSKSGCGDCHAGFWPSFCPIFSHCTCNDW